MSTDNSRNPPTADMSRQRRSSVSNPLTNLLRSGSTSGATVFPSPINDQRRRLSISTLGLAGTSPNGPTTPFNLRRGSISTNSDSIDENAVDDDEPTSAKTAPTTPFTRRMSFGASAMRNLRIPPGASSAGSNGRPSPPLRRSSGLRGGPPTPPTSSASATGMTWNKNSSQASTATSQRAASDLIPARSDQGFNWSEQLRSRAESIASGSRPSVSYASGIGNSPPRGNSLNNGPPMSDSGLRHDRAKSVSDMPAPPAQAPKPRPQKPDPFQERILKGDFYMD